MKRNNYNFIKYSLILLTISIAFLIAILFLENHYYRLYNNNYNNKLNSIMNIVIDKYPDISKQDLIEIINNNSNGYNVLKEYGINLNRDSLVLKNEKEYKLSKIFISLIVLSFYLILLIIIYIREYKYNKNINEITGIIKKINNKNYKINLDDYTEGEFSVLKSEIYKTTIMLKEQAENSTRDKLSLKDSLSDISHQLKTPLTSINIMLDNILDNPDMDNETRIRFVNEIKREMVNINFLVISILKLSRLDTNMVNFTVEKIKLKDIIDNSIKNVSAICDLKNIVIDVTGDEKITVNCDFNWQVEALTNIVKNSIEHSNNNSLIEITYFNNKMYSEIHIKDYGKGINKKDLNHIFERFYKGTNTSNDSFGIGLALSKSIIEQNNGTISVQSEIDKGTTFIIKYY